MQQFYNKAMLFGPVVIITTGSPLPSAEVGFAYSTPLVAQGGVGPYTFALFSGSLPAGLSIVGASIAGTPTTIQVMNPNIRATDSLGHQSAVKAFNITVISAVSITTTSPLPNATQGSAYTDTMAASGGAGGYVWSLVSQTGTNGWVVSSGGVVSGTPAHVETDNLTIKVTDALGYAAQGIFSLLVNSATGALAITTTSPLPNATQSTPYTDTMAATGGVPPYTWSLLGQTGSNGWSVSSAGVVTGTPTAVETDTLTIQVLDSMATPASGNFNLTVNSSGAMSWKRLLVGGGGFVRGMNIVADGTMVARTDTNGAYYYNGTSWQQLFNTSSLPSSFVNGSALDNYSQGCFEIQIAPSNTQIFYGCFDGFVWVSSNRGATWTQTAFAQNAGGMPPNADGGNGGNGRAQYGQRMAIDPQNSNIVFVGTVNAGLSFTTNGGATWTQISTSTIPVGNGSGITGILFDPSSSVVGGATQGIYAASYGNGVYHSSNGGATWALTTSGPTNIQYAAIDSSGNYYAIGNTGANGFKYNGSTWSTILSPAGGDTLQAVAVNPLNISEVVVVGFGGEPYISQNAGASFAAVNRNGVLSTPDIPWLFKANYPAGQPTGFYSLDAGGMAFSPITNGLLFLSGGTGMWQMNLPAGAGSGTALTWTDFSITIEQLVANDILIAPFSGSTPILASGDRPFFNISSLTSYPSTYGPINSDTISYGYSLDYASSSPSTIVGLAGFAGGAGAQNGITTNNGVTWTNFATTAVGWNQSFGNGGGCIAASTPTNIVWAPAGGTAPSFTTNGGSTWTVISISGIASWSGFEAQYFQSPNQKGVAADRVNANTFYLYFPGKGVYISTNGGAAWTQQKSGFIEANGSWSGFGSTLRSVPGNAGHLFYTSGNVGSQTFSNAQSIPFYRSTDSGVTWSAVAGVNGVQVFNLGAIAPGNSYPSIYVAGFVANVFGVYYSVDNAVTWTAIGTPLSTLQTLSNISCIAADPNNFGSVYVGLTGSGYARYGS